jgi:hypothetical protein
MNFRPVLLENNNFRPECAVNEIAYPISVPLINNLLPVAVQCSKELGVHGDSLLYTLDDWQV